MGICDCIIIIPEKKIAGDKFLNSSMNNLKKTIQNVRSMILKID
jgi:hypothetical protein